MAIPDHTEIEKARSFIVELMRQEYANHSLDKLDLCEFGNTIAPLVNALAALSLIEKQQLQAHSLGEASRSDD